ncbi:uncharacterized protein LOC113283741 [Papaver somniferum]|uniref:uncharacterized protein LOC113283741 n=1 Tax=Papaver somniferum TaxID=3469 RepID=UPI000E6F62E2|nr:uncharacterized protein LOC113283741 [Papaver somniferum]
MGSKRLELQEALKKQKPSTTKHQEALQNQRRSTKKRQEALHNQRLSTTKPRSASVNSGRLANEIVTDAVDERLKVVAPEKQKLSATKPCSALISGSRENEIVTDSVDERLNVEKQRSPATKPCSLFVNGTSANKIVTDAVEKEKLPTKKPHVAYVDGPMKYTLDEIYNARLFLLRSRGRQQQNHVPAIVNGRRAKEIVTDVVGERLNAAALKKQSSSTTKSSIAVANGSWANKIVTNPVDGKLKAVGDILDVGNDIRDDDADILDGDGDYDVHIAEDQYLLNDSDEDADILDADGDSDVHIVEDQLLPTDSDEVADILDVHGDSDVHIVEDQSLPTYSDEDADLFDADGDSDVHIAEDQLLPTNSENSSRKRSREMAWRQVTDPHSESNNANCTYNGQGSTSMPSDTRIPIIFDKYGRPCDVGSEKFVTDIGRLVRAHCRPAIESWKIVPNSMKDNIWKDIVARYVVPEVYKPHVLSRASKSWKGWKQHLRRELDKHETVAERKIKIPWRLITNRDDWESFVDFCNSDEHMKLRAAGKKAQEASEFTQSCGRKGIFRKIYELEKASPTGEVNRAAIFVGTHTSRNDLGEDKMKLVKELVEANPDGQKDIDNDAVALVCGRDSRGSVKGMGGGVSRTTIHASATTLEILRKVQQENKSLQSDLHLLRTQLGEHTPNHTSTPSSQSAPHTQNRTSIPSNQSAPPAQNPTFTPSNQSASHIQNRTSTPSNESAPRAQNRSSTPSSQSASRIQNSTSIPSNQFVPRTQNRTSTPSNQSVSQNLKRPTCLLIHVWHLMHPTCLLVHVCHLLRPTCLLLVHVS